MDCIDSTITADTTQLFTQADKISRLEEIFSKHRQKADLFLPDETFYPEICGPEEIRQMADTLFRWLGIKHRSVHFHLDPSQDTLISYKKKSAASEITLGWHCVSDGFLAAAAIAHGIVHHLLIARQKLWLDSVSETEELTDLGTIYAGFGILILNSLGSSRHALGSLAPPNYVSEFFDYVSAERIVESVWSPYILPDVMSSHIGTVRPVRQQTFVQRRMKHLRQTKLHRRLAILAFAASFGVFGLVMLTRPKAQSADQLAKFDEIQVLKRQIEQCEDTVRRKTANWNQDDIFIQRQIDADKSRCSSLRSRYNYEVNLYNASIE